MGKPTRIGVVGVGKIARDQHIPAIAANEAFTLVACASRHGHVDGIPNFPTIAEMLDDCDLDAVAICTPAAGPLRSGEAGTGEGKHVLLEKPPCTSTLQLDHLTRLAADAGRTLYQTWHSQHAHGVAPAQRLLKERALEGIRVTWKENVRQWHPGQTWIWQAGGFGVLDPGINALSILARIVPEPFFPRAARLFVPSNCEAPIAAEIDFITASGKPIAAELDFRHTGVQTWDIDIDTREGPLKLSAGGAILTIGEQEVPRDPGALDNEYHAIYRDFAALIARGQSEVDARPLQLVADIFMTAKHITVEPFRD